jgi:hypothetical protein
MRSAIGSIAFHASVYWPEHLVQRLKHRALDVPMEVVRLQVKDVRIGEQAR